MRRVRQSPVDSFSDHVPPLEFGTDPLCTEISPISSGTVGKVFVFGYVTVVGF